MPNDENIALTGDGKALAAFIGGGVTLLAIGILNFLSEMSESIHDALEFYKPVGPYSGKITLGVLCGAIVWVILYYVLKDKEKAESKAGFIFFIASLLIATLFVFTPFIKLFVDAD